MSDKDDTIERERLKPLPFVRPPAKAVADKDVIWPELDDPYEAAGKVDAHEIPCLVVVMGRDGFKPDGKSTAYYELQYIHIGLGQFGFAEGGGQWFSFLFSDREPKLLMAWGRNLLRYYAYIGRRRLPWIRVQDRDFGGGGEPVFTRIEVTDWEPEEES
jgi:hypothetical protein